MSPARLKLERIVWRWALLATVLGAAYVLGVSRRYEELECHTTEDAEFFCFLLDTRTGNLIFRQPPRPQ